MPMTDKQDTPRTDAVIRQWMDEGCTTAISFIALSRQFERELTALRARIEAAGSEKQLCPCFQCQRESDLLIAKFCYWCGAPLPQPKIKRGIWA